MRHLDLFSGIGGFALAAQTVWGDEYENIGFCDNDKFCQQVLKKHWPNSPIYEDIKQLTADTSRQRPVEGGENSGRSAQRSSCGNPSPLLITGGFPCQPFSAAGRRRGTADDRHLWPEMFRIIREFAPLWVVAENVRGLATWSDGMVLEQVCADLESAGYEVQPFIIPAVALNAPHRRERIWFVAYRSGDRWERQGKAISPQEGHATRPEQAGQLAGRPQGSYSNASDTKSAGSQWRDRKNGKWTDYPEEWHMSWSENKRYSWNRPWPQVATELCGVDDGLPAELDGFKLTKPAHRRERLKSLGNAIVPQVAMEIFKIIQTI